MAYKVAVPSRDGTVDVNLMQGVYAAATAAGIEVSVFPGAYSVAHNRNQAVWNMYINDCDGLIFVDDDVCVPLDAFELMLAAEKDIVCACVPNLKYSGRSNNATIPYVMIGEHEHRIGTYQWYDRWPPPGLFETHTCTTACTLISRAVFDALGPEPWFVWPPDVNMGDTYASDDTHFMKRAREAGFGVYCCGDVRCGHYKRINLYPTIPDKPRTYLYGSHMGALGDIGAAFDIRTVTEYGCGNFSTLTFLDRTIFPHVERVISYEHEEEWFEHFSEKCKDDSRLRMQLCHAERMPSVTWGAEAPDLIMIDNGPDEEYETAYEIRARLFQLASSSQAIVVLHDIDFHKTIGEAFGQVDYEHKMIYRPDSGPCTGVASNAHDLETILTGDKWQAVTRSPDSRMTSNSTAQAIPSAP